MLRVQVVLPWEPIPPAPESPRSRPFLPWLCLATELAFRPPLPRSAGVSKRPRASTATIIMSTNSAIPLFWNNLTLSDGLLTVYEVA
jgi:hypothetical protein